MIIQTEKDLGKWFTKNGQDKFQLISTTYHPTKNRKTVTLLSEGSVVIESLESFKEDYTSTSQYLPKGTPCECLCKSGAKILLYSDGEGGYYINKGSKGSLYRIHRTHADLKSVKKLT